MEQAPNTKLGSYHQERRNSFLGKLVDDTLSIQPIQWMLRKLSTKEEESKRRKELYELYQVAADRSSSQANMRGHFEFHGLDCLPEVFHLASNMIEPHTLHFLQEGSTRLDGRRVLMVVYPGITRKWIDESAIWGHEISSKAYVVVEDPEDPKGGEELKGKDKDELSR